MANYQREMKRAENKAKKDRKNKRIIWTVIILALVVIAAMKLSEININTVKQRLTDSDNKISLSQNITKSNFPYSIDSSQGVTVKNINNKLAVLTPTSYTVIDTKLGTSNYSFDHGYSNAIMRSSGIYSLIFDQGNKTLRLDNTSENVYEKTLEGDILCADVAKNGNVAVASVSGDKLCNVTIYNKAMKSKLSFDIDYGYVTNIAINNSGSKISFVAVNSKNAQLKSKLYTMNIGTNEPKAQIDLPACNVLELKYNSSNLYVIGDNYIGIVSNQKKLKDVFECGKINTVCYNFTPSNELILAYNDYSNSTDNKLVRVRGGGSTRTSADLTGNIKYITASSSTVSVLSDSNITSYRLGNLKEKKKITVDDSVKSICQMGSTVFVHKQSVIDKSESEKQ